MYINQVLLYNGVLGLGCIYINQVLLYSGDLELIFYRMYINQVLLYNGDLELILFRMYINQVLLYNGDLELILFSMYINQVLLYNGDLELILFRMYINQVLLYNGDLELAEEFESWEAPRFPVTGINSSNHFWEEKFSVDWVLFRFCYFLQILIQALQILPKFEVNTFLNRYITCAVTV